MTFLAGFLLGIIIGIVAIVDIACIVGRRKEDEHSGNNGTSNKGPRD